MNEIYFVICTMPPWPHSDDNNMLYHAPRRADQPLPCTTNTASYAHSPKYPYHDPSIKYAPARRPHESWHPNNTPRLRPIPNSLRLPLCLLPLEFLDWSFFEMDDDFSRMHSAYGLNFWFSIGSAIWVRLQLPCDTLYTFPTHTHFIPPHPFDPLFPSSCNVVVLSYSLESRRPDVKSI